MGWTLTWKVSWTFWEFWFGHLFRIQRIFCCMLNCDVMVMVRYICVYLGHQDKRHYKYLNIKNERNVWFLDLWCNMWIFRAWCFEWYFSIAIVVMAFFRCLIDSEARYRAFEALLRASESSHPTGTASGPGGGAERRKNRHDHGRVAWRTQILPGKFCCSDRVGGAAGSRFETGRRDPCGRHHLATLSFRENMSDAL